MQKHHSISYMKENLPLYEQKGYVRGEMPDTNVSLEEAQGNDVDEIEKPEVSPFAGASSGSAARYEHYDPQYYAKYRCLVSKCKELKPDHI